MMEVAVGTRITVNMTDGVDVIRRGKEKRNDRKRGSGRRANEPENIKKKLKQ